VSGRQAFLLLIVAFAAVLAANGMSLAEGKINSEAARTLPAARTWDMESAQAFSQAAIGNQVRPLLFRNRRGREVRLADFRGKPVIVNLVYTACTNSCSVIVEILHRSVVIAQDALGGDKFTVLTVGFDTRNDTPARMRAFATSRSIRLANWHFLSADQATIDRLANDLGFMYRASAGGFEHLAQTTIIDSKGKVYRQIYGGDFWPPAVVEPLKDLIYGRRGNLASVSGIINRIRLFCTVYSSGGERYRFDYGIFVALIVGFMCLGTVGFVLVRAGIRAFSSHRLA